MPKLEIANNNRYGHRRIEEVPRWDRWDTRMPDVKDQLRAIDLYNKSGAVSKSDFVRARILGERFKVIMVESPQLSITASSLNSQPKYIRLA